MCMLGLVDHNFLFSSKGMAFHGITTDTKYIQISFDFNENMIASIRLCIDTNFPRERKSRISFHYI